MYFYNDFLDFDGSGSLSHLCKATRDVASSWEGQEGTKTFCPDWGSDEVALLEQGVGPDDPQRSFVTIALL